MSDQTIPHITETAGSAVLYAPATEAIPHSRVYYDLYTLIQHYAQELLVLVQTVDDDDIRGKYLIEGARQMLEKMNGDLETLTLLAEFSIPDDLGGLEA